MSERYRVCPECGVEQPEAALSTYWKQRFNEPWRFGHLARGCRWCKHHGRAESSRLVIVGEVRKAIA